MKAHNLKRMQKFGINIPKFIVVENSNDRRLTKLKEGKYSVRSSCSIEDSLNKSFAGQFKTFLNVGNEHLYESIDKVLESMNNYDFSKYIDKKYKIHNRVIVQHQIDSKYSGVIFTANPLGIKNETVIVIGKGTGDNIVEDKVETATYYYNLDDNIYYQSGIHIDIDEQQLKEIIDTSKSIKKLFKYEADIEFAIDKQNKLWILQARPITTLKNTWKLTLDSSNIAESYPGITLPLTQEFVAEIYEGVFKSAVELIVKNKDIINKINFKNIVRFVNGRAYYDIQVFYDIFHLLPFDKFIINIWQNSLGVENKQVTPSKIDITIFKKIKYLKLLKESFINNEKNMHELSKYFNNTVDYFRKQVSNSNTISELLDCYENLKSILCNKWSITLINDMYTFFFSALVHDKEKISNISSLESMKPILIMNDLINDKHNEDLKKQYIELYGDRCIGELKLETKTYRTNPELLDQYINSHNTTEIQNITINEDNKNITKAKHGIYYRELSRMNRSRIFGIAREIFIKIGNILLEENRIEKLDDVWYLNKKDFTSDMLLTNKISSLRKQYNEFDKIPYFTRLIFDEKEFNSSIKVESNGTITNNTLYGVATSTGIEIAEAIIVDEPSNSLDAEGKIIVAKSTDPGWVTLIKNAKAIVVERGSILSHTAIITRELGKPSVVNVKNATKIIKNGDRIYVNGVTGEVKILCKSMSA